MQEPSPYLHFLKKSPAFEHLSSEDLTWLSLQCKPVVAQTGDELLAPNTYPDYWYLLTAGQARIVYSDPVLHRSATLAYVNPGDLIGWVGLARNLPCEWTTAKTTLELLAFKRSVFTELIERSQHFFHWLESNTSPAEILHVLLPSITSTANYSIPLRDLIREIVPSIKLLPSESQHTLRLDQGSTYLWNAQLHSQIPRPGTTVCPDDLQLIRSESASLRLFQINNDIWQSIIHPSSQDLSASQPLEAINPSPKAWSSNRYSDLLLPLQSNSDPHTEADSQSLRRYPCVTGYGLIPESMATLEMISQYYEIPFRRDVIERAVKHEVKSPITLQTIGSLSTILSLIPSIAEIESPLFSRIPTPFLLINDGQPITVFKTSKQYAYCVAPRSGRIRFDISELFDGKKSLSVLTLRTSRDTQRTKLGFSWFLPQLKRYRKSLLEVLVSSLLLQLLNLAQPLVMQQIFDKVIVQQNLDTLYTLGIVLLGVSLFQGLIGSVRTYLFADTTNRIDIALGSEVIHHLLRLPLRYFDKRPVGELQTRIAELANIRGFLTGSLLTLTLDALFSVIYVAVMLMYSGILTVVTLGLVPLFLALTYITSPIIRNQLRIAAERNAASQAFLIESLNGVQTIKAQNAENNVRWQWQRRYSSFMSESFRSLVIGVTSGTVGGFLNQLTGLLTLWVGAYLVIAGDLTIGQLIAFRIISGYVIGPLLNIATSWQTFQGVALSIERLSDVIDAPPEGGDNDSDQLPLPPLQGDVEFKDVSFSFTTSAPLVAKNVSFKINAGQFVGIVGRSGSGKSTIMKLLPRLYEPNKGSILIDGYDISKLQLSSVRKQIGIVPQDSLLFDGSVRDNIALTSPDASFDEIVKACRIACAHDFIMSLPDGYSTRVGERGSSLSGGQRQRLAIARSILQKPNLLILDEATSALDYLTERQVCNNLKSSFKGSTVFFITHRLSTIRSADEILFMENGILVEQGTHHDLLASKGRYFALLSQQESDLG